MKSKSSELLESCKESLESDLCEKSIHFSWIIISTFAVDGNCSMTVKLVR